MNNILRDFEHVLYNYRYRERGRNVERETRGLVCYGESFEAVESTQEALTLWDVLPGRDDLVNKLR